jgi:DNA polymerase-3 subunit gamma/tau
VQAAPVPVQAAEMAILRLIHALELPDPGMLARLLQDGASAAPLAGQMPAAAPPAAPVLSMPLAPAAASATPDFAALVALFRQNREPRLANLLHDQLRLVSLAPGQLVLAASDVDKDVPLALARCLKAWTGTDWTVEVRGDGGGMTMLEAEQAAQAALEADARTHPIVAALTEHYPDAELKVTKIHAQS